MDDLKTQLSHLGREVGRVSDQHARPEAIAAARRRWLSPEAAPRPRRALLPRLSIVLACAAVAAALWLFVSRPRAAVSFEVGAPPVQGAVGEWIAAGVDIPLAVRFSEGSALSLRPGARIRVTETSARGAAVLIERGALRASVVRRASGTQWALRAGPFEVQVTGTAFDVEWDPGGEVLDVRVEEGTVIVAGPLLQPGRDLTAGERLRVSVRDRRLEITSNRNAEAASEDAARGAPLATEAPAQAEAVPSQDAAASAAPRSPGVEETKQADAAPSWRALAGAGKHREAIEVAERAGVEAEIARASAADLLVLADTARFAARPALAREALLALRRRFGASGRSAFLLGKIAADQLGAGGEAATWFETYLREEPGGPLAEQALGRLIELRRGDPAGARAAAERYLERYPDGAYAPLAKSLLTP